MYELLRSIQHCHSLSVFHRDIKPQNILIDPSGVLKLCDFGFARQVQKGQELTDYVATRWYRPPELLLRQTVYDASIDVWAAGCIFGEMVDSQPVYPGIDDMDMLTLIRKSLGELTSHQEECLLKDPRFVGQKQPEITSFDSLEKRYYNKLERQGIDLMKKMLILEPTERITAAKALAHPYFNSLRKDKEKEPQSFVNSATSVEPRGKLVLERIVDSKATKVKVQMPPVRKEEPALISKILPPGSKNSTIYERKFKDKQIFLPKRKEELLKVSKIEEELEGARGKSRGKRKEEEESKSPVRQKGREETRLNLILNQNVYNFMRR